MQWVNILFQGAQAAVAAAGGISAWERLGEEHRTRHNATLAEFVRGIGQEEFDKLSDQDKQDVDPFMWLLHAQSECVQGCGFIDARMMGGQRGGAIARSRDFRFSQKAESRKKAFRGNLTRDRSGRGGFEVILRPVLCAGKEEVQNLVYWLTEKIHWRTSLSLASPDGLTSIPLTPSQTGALVDTIHDGPRHNDGRLLASLAHGHNDASTATNQLQQTAFDPVFRASENTSRPDALAGSVQMCGDAPITFAIPSLPTQAPAAPFFPPVVLAQPPFIAPVLAAVPARPVPTAVATQPALATADDNCMSDMQAMFTAALSAVPGTKHAREGNELDNNACNVRHHSSSSLAAPASSSYTPVPDAPAPGAPATPPAHPLVVLMTRHASSSSAPSNGSRTSTRRPARSSRRACPRPPTCAPSSCVTAPTRSTSCRSGAWSSVVARPN
ncbi:hypothetical protein DFH09DRAFT_1084492 [Mycena vulgaris]|nr:hypothetical protein DFH09DRAFT_1084492 [Mycena vulgaris]